MYFQRMTKLVTHSDDYRLAKSQTKRHGHGSTKLHKAAIKLIGFPPR